MAQKAKHRSKTVSTSAFIVNRDGPQPAYTWVPGDPPELHPLFSSLGAFKDDPFWDEFVQAMDDERLKIDERYPVQDDQKADYQENEQSVRA